MTINTQIIFGEQLNTATMPLVKDMTGITLLENPLNTHQGTNHVPFTNNVHHAQDTNITQKITNLAVKTGITLGIAGTVALSLYSAPIITAIALAAIPITAFSIAPFVGTDKAIEISEQCLTEAISIEAPVQLLLSPFGYAGTLPSLLVSKSSSYFVSCSVRKAATIYYLDPKGESFHKILGVSITSGMAGGAYKYVVSDALLGDLGNYKSALFKAVKGGINAALYSLVSNSAKYNNPHSETASELSFTSPVFIEGTEGILNLFKPLIEENKGLNILEIRDGLLTGELVILSDTVLAKSVGELVESGSTSLQEAIHQLVGANVDTNDSDEL